MPVRDFLSRHPEGTVVEIGAGLNTRFERLDNGAMHWFDLDLPDSIELRKKFFTDSERRTTLTASVLDPGWMDAVRQSPGPYFFVAEAVLIYLTEQQVKLALAQIAASFPNATIAFDCMPLNSIRHGNKDHARQKFDARFTWACEDPIEIERWKIGLATCWTPAPCWTSPARLRSRLSLPTRAVLRILLKFRPQIANICRLNLFTVHSEA